ncbi:unnamed protein product, partial [Ectocarpus sp. 8 AP-2014]
MPLLLLVLSRLQLLFLPAVLLTLIRQIRRAGPLSLMIASRQGHSRIVRMFLDKGAEVLITEDRGYTALHQSALAGHPAVTKMLVEAGAP